MERPSVGDFIKERKQAEVREIRTHGGFTNEEINDYVKGELMEKIRQEQQAKQEKEVKKE